MTKVIYIAGYKRSGKDTFGLFLKEALEANGKKVELVSFADPMKRILATTLGISLEFLDNCKNNSNFPHRGYLERFGSEAMKPEFGEDVWVDLVNKYILRSTADIVIVPDFRFRKEYSESAAFPYTIKVQRDNVTPSKGFIHISERDLNGFDFDKVITNNGTLDELRESAYTLIKKEIL